MSSRERNQIPQYSFRDHPYIQDGRGLGHSEYEDKYMKPRNKHNSSTVNLETEQDGSQRLFDSQVIDQKQTHRPVEGDVVTQNSKYPDQYASNQPNRQIVQKSGQNNDKQFDDLPQYNREDINTGHNDRQAKAQAK